MGNPDDEKPKGLGPAKPNGEEPEAGKRAAAEDRIARGTDPRRKPAD